MFRHFSQLTAMRARNNCHKAIIRAHKKNSQLRKNNKMSVTSWQLVVVSCVASCTMLLLLVFCCRWHYKRIWGTFNVWHRSKLANFSCVQYTWQHMLQKYTYTHTNRYTNVAAGTRERVLQKRNNGICDKL